MFAGMRLVLAAGAASVLAGCSIVEATADRALVSRNTGEVRAVATRADRRITFVDENWMWGEDRERENVAYRMTMTSAVSPADQYMFDRYQAHHYCAEPSPDVSQDVLTRLAAEIGEGNLGLSGQLDSNARIEALFHRSQGVQLFRDGLFALCQAHHNGAVGADDYGIFIASLIQRASYLIALELALMPESGTADGDRVPEILDAALRHLAPAGRQHHPREGMMAVAEPGGDACISSGTGCTFP